MTLLNLHNSLVFFPFNFCPFPMVLFQLHSYTGIPFNNSICYRQLLLIFCWEFSYSEIVLIKHNYGSGDEGNSVSYSVPAHTFRHSLIARVEILLQVCSYWFYYLNWALGGHSWKCQSLSFFLTLLWLLII